MPNRFVGCRVVIGLAAAGLVVTACTGTSTRGRSPSSATPGATSATSAAAASSTGGDGGGSSPAASAPGTGPVSRTPVSSAPVSSAPVSSAPASSSAPSSAPPSPSPSGLAVPASTGALRLYGSVTIPGAFSADENLLTVGQGPDGAIFVAGPQSNSGAEVLWAVDGTKPATIAEHLSEPAYSIAADATYLYVGFARTINAYSRTTGALVRTWKPSAAIPGERVEQIVVAGNRIWALLTVLTSSGSTLQANAEGAIEIDPSATAIVREVPDIANALSLAATSSGVFYVYDQSSKVQEQTNDGHTITKNANQQVNIELSGQAAIQAVGVFDGELILQHDAGQGLDAVLDAYDATTLAGPTKETDFSADEQLVATPTGMFVVGTPDTTVCAATQQQCVARFALGSAGATDPVALPRGTLTSELSGPYPTVVLGVGNNLQVLRIG